jgi:hypothetical protein
MGSEESYRKKIQTFLNFLHHNVFHLNFNYYDEGSEFNHSPTIIEKNEKIKEEIKNKENTKN